MAQRRKRGGALCTGEGVEPRDLALRTPSLSAAFRGAPPCLPVCANYSWAREIGKVAELNKRSFRQAGIYDGMYHVKFFSNKLEYQDVCLLNKPLTNAAKLFEKIIHNQNTKKAQTHPFSATLMCKENCA